MVWGGGGALWAAGGCICGIFWGLWCALVGSACRCVGWVFADVQWGMSMYTGSHCVALDHNLVGFWFLSLHSGFLLCIGGYAGGGMLVGCAWWRASHFFFVFVFGVSYGCGFGLFMGPPSTLDYVSSYLFSFI